MILMVEPSGRWEMSSVSGESSRCSADWAPVTEPSRTETWVRPNQAWEKSSLPDRTAVTLPCTVPALVAGQPSSV